MGHKFIWTMVGIVFLAIGCARVEVQAPKDPIKMDISMRLDVYQHVSKDIDDIESIVSGKSDPKNMSLSSLILPNAYADGGLSPEAEQAAYRRRDRLAEINALKSSGAAAEGSSALLVAGGSADAHAQQVLNDENSDRMIIYQAIANKNGTSVQEVQKIYVERLKN